MLEGLLQLPSGIKRKKSHTTISNPAHPGRSLDVSDPVGAGLARVHEQGHVREAVAVVWVGTAAESLANEELDALLHLQVGDMEHEVTIM